MLQGHNINLVLINSRAETKSFDPTNSVEFIFELIFPRCCRFFFWDDRCRYAFNVFLPTRPVKRSTGVSSILVPLAGDFKGTCIKSLWWRKTLCVSNTPCIAEWQDHSDNGFSHHTLLQCSSAFNVYDTQKLLWSTAAFSVSYDFLTTQWIEDDLNLKNFSNETVQG